ncbi:mannose-1-phosphate guanylyltransferase/mannose-6-phosphate isomerase [Pseudaestuariivita atlantica]|uniref:mannose-1-phosphate guanylyltransferase n=1 Tax=Pseudaestuariivita atlantica TaxID=1317121 RepID=A0A0L1JMV7_9RHOB|nr:mannose-1-phosphate guanylyltransferase/mannose-6-phosphate isomerase [Pseudaestuariivita atlantica]KNG93084.1 mannose-1-phosphate guanyltransferase [Pseudaestuariivita atlantica]
MITPIILAGGSGTRLWPVSRKAYPKQFTSLAGDQTLYQDTLKRLSHLDAPVVITGTDYRFIAAEQAAEAEQDLSSIMIEPEGRNTAPAILTAALMHEDTPDAILLIMPSDHIVADEDGFRAALEEGRIAAEESRIVTFGSVPTRPETGYGYLELVAPAGACKAALPLISFVEKPDADRAADMIATGKYLWNGGMFMARVDTLIEAFDTHAPHLMLPCRAALAGAQTDLDFTRLAAGPWAKLEDISVDYAIMEKHDDLVVVPMDCGWSDMGSWDSVWRESPQDADGNVMQGNATAMDCTDTLLRSDNDGVELVGLGLEGITAIATGDAILVARTDDSQKVKEVLATLKAKEAKQATEFSKCHRPWGHYETLALGPRFQVKRIVVKPGAQLSLQSHHHRSEHWTVVEGSAIVHVDGEDMLKTENESTYIPLGAVHRLSNPGKLPLTLIEVQSGCYLGEDDIVRYEDIYARAEAKAA